MAEKKRLTKCSRNMAWYLYCKWRDGNISQDMIERMFTDDACTFDIFGGWFVDFHYDIF